MKPLLLSLLLLVACSGPERAAEPAAAAPIGVAEDGLAPPADAPPASGDEAIVEAEAQAGQATEAPVAEGDASVVEPAPEAEAPEAPEEPEAAEAPEADAAPEADEAPEAVEVAAEPVAEAPPAQDEPAGETAAAAGQDAAAPPDQQAGPDEPEVVIPGAEPVDMSRPPLVSIPDIDKHRAESLPYVRKLEDYVELDLGPIDLEADPILVVEGKPVARAEFRRRALMYAGENEVDKRITSLLIEQQLEREAARGVDVSVYAVEREDVEAKLAELKELVRMQAMQPAAAEGGSEEDAATRGDEAVQTFVDAIESSIGMEAYLKLLTADAQFELVFLPFPEETVEGEKHDFEQGPPPEDEPRPDWLPQESWDALGGDEQGRMLRTFLKTWAIDGTGIPMMFKPNLLAKIRSGLLATQGVTFFFDAELPPEVLLRVGDREVLTDDMWPIVKPYLSDADVDLIVREMLTLRAMRKALEAADRWLDDEEFAAAWQAENDQYAQTLLPLQTMIMFRGYSSLDRYREHFRYRQSYNEWRREGLSDDEVLAHYQGGGRLMFERGTVVVDIFYAPLGELPFGDASLDQRAEELGAAVEAARATGEGWVDIVAERFPAPPPQQGLDAHAMQRSQIRMRMAESELSILLTGYSLADDLFYHAHPGDVYGPWAERCRRHAFGADLNAGAWMVHVRDFSRRSPLAPFDGTNRDLAYQDFLDLNFFHWAQESLKALLSQVSLPTS